MPDEAFRHLLTEEVHQATGMVAMQLDCSMAEALGRLVIRAQSTGRTLDQLALDIIDRELRLYK